MSEKTLRDLFAGFCPISGSVLSYNRGVLRVQMTLPAVYGGTETGMMYYCCSPCVCDTQDFLKVDTKTIQLADGAKQAHFVVIGNPCKHQEKIPMQAPDVNCDPNQDLVKATLSDHGHIIIGMFFEPGIKDHSDSSAQKSDQGDFAGMCQGRADAGHNSGMGMIFREVAAIAPIPVSESSGSRSKVAPPETLQSGKDAQTGLAGGSGATLNSPGASTSEPGQTSRPAQAASSASMQSFGATILLAMIYAIA